jgi:uncharacterized membrane protein YbaN (DUF454 family)
MHESSFLIIFKNVHVFARSNDRIEQRMKIQNNLKNLINNFTDHIAFKCKLYCLTVRCIDIIEKNWRKYHERSKHEANVF